MPVVKRNDIAGFLKSTSRGKLYPVYLVTGERYLCRKAADDLVNCLLPDGRQREHNLINIDGDREDPADTLKNLKTYSLFPGRRVIRVVDSRLFYSKELSGNLWEKIKKSHSDRDVKRAALYLARLLSFAGLGPAEIDVNELSGLSDSKWLSIFGFAKPREKLDWLGDLRAFMDDNSLPPDCSADISDRYVKAFESGIPADNFLILQAEAVDKRKGFFKFIKKNGVVLDLSFDQRGGTAARKDQDARLQELAIRTFTDFGKKINPGILKLFIERVGFYPAALVMEAEKLSLFVGEEETITKAHLDAVVGRTREEALYEVTAALALRNIEQSVLILERLRRQGIHALAVVSVLRNYFKKVMVVRSLQALPAPPYSPGMSYGEFKDRYVPQLKADNEKWPAFLTGHPYALYKTFQQAGKFDPAELKAGLAALLDAEYHLKGSMTPDYLILENFVFKFLGVSQTGI